MNPARIPSDTRVLPTTLPRRIPGSGDAALLIYGFTAWPGERASLGDRLADAELAVSIPRLPGHGTNGRDFLQTGWRDWLRAVVDGYLELAATHSRIHVVGFSLGGLLAVFVRRVRCQDVVPKGLVDPDDEAVLGGKDPTVPLSAWDFIRARIGSGVLERVVLPGSTHQIPAGVDRDRAADVVVRWLTAPAPAGTVRA